MMRKIRRTFLHSYVYFIVSINFLKFLLFIYLFLAVLGLRGCAQAFASCGKWSYSLATVHGLLTVGASLVAEPGL